MTAPAADDVLRGLRGDDEDDTTARLRVLAEHIERMFRPVWWGGGVSRIWRPPEPAWVCQSCSATAGHPTAAGQIKHEESCLWVQAVIALGENPAAIDLCPGCGNPIDRSVCWCGDTLPHSYGDCPGAPAGCECRESIGTALDAAEK